MANLFNLTKKQRLDMQMQGLSPLNPEHVEKYINAGGNVGTSMKESIERAKTLIGEEAFANTSLGHKDSWSGGHVKSTGNIETDIRNQLKNDMEGYSNKRNLMESLEDFDIPVRRTKQPTSQVSVQEIQQLGYTNTIAYLNAFIRNLKNPTSAGRMEIYKTLQASLQKEQSFKNNQNALKAYQSGCKKAESEMFDKLRK